MNNAVCDKRMEYLRPINAKLLSNKVEFKLEFM